MENKLVVTGGGQYGGGGVGDRNYWMQDRLKDVLYDMGIIVNIL